MDRKTFIAKTGLLTLACLCVGGCTRPGEDAGASPNPDKTDFTLDLASVRLASLQTVGGFAYEKLIIIVRTGSREFVAFGQYCTHAAGVIAFVPSRSHFECPVHGSIFDLTGKVVQGPATRPLKKYNTALADNILRVFE
jgi:cytochrome b6-f complex iron-sulfur subunit